jgi:hypothetical protein
METIAIRTYPLDDLYTGIEYEARDYLYRKPDGAFILRETSNSPNDASGEDKPLCIEGAFARLCEMPDQIEIMCTAARDTSLEASEAIRRAAH